MLVAAMLASIVPVRRALRINPTEALGRRDGVSGPPAVRSVDVACDVCPNRGQMAGERIFNDFVGARPLLAARSFSFLVVSGDTCTSIVLCLTGVPLFGTRNTS